MAATGNNSHDGGDRGRRFAGLTGRVTDRVTALWLRYMTAAPGPEESARISETALEAAPVLWLIGKVQSGKSSIVQAVTGQTAAEVGNGFRPCTRTARVYDYPPEAPLIRFLDTRGLGEAGYDPAEDLTLARRKAHALVAVVRAMDPAIDDVVAAVAEVRRDAPDWPVIVAQTSLHDAYPPGRNHRMPYPFRQGGPAGEISVGVDGAALPDELLRALEHQRRRFAAVGGTAPVLFVPIDFTQPDDGLEPRHYGLDALLDALTEAAPAGIAAMLRQLQAAGRDRLRQRAAPRILGHASVAAAIDVVPVAGAIAVPGVQAKLLHVLAQIYGTAWDRATLAAFAGCLGTGIVTRLLATFGIRQLVKLIPVYGQTAGAAAAAATSFATTYALGHAAQTFLAHRRHGTVDPDTVTRAYREALATALKLEKRGIGPTGSASTETRNAP